MEIKGKSYEKQGKKYLEEEIKKNFLYDLKHNSKLPQSTKIQNKFKLRNLSLNFSNLDLKFVKVANNEYSPKQSNSKLININNLQGKTKST